MRKRFSTFLCALVAAAALNSSCQSLPPDIKTLQDRVKQLEEEKLYCEVESNECIELLKECEVINE